VDHQEYIERYLSADVDGELNADEQQAVSSHLAGCDLCRQRRAAEIELKRLLRERLPFTPAPADLRERIVAALETVARAPARAPRFTLRRRSVRMSIGLVAAIAAAIAVFVTTHQPANPEFDAAIAAYLKAEQQFTPNIPSASVDDMAVALAAQFGFPFIWDFSSIGLSLVGARVDHAADQRAIAQAFYKGPGGSLLCIMRREDTTLSFPSGGRTIRGVKVYDYRGFSISETQYNTVYCVMVTRLSAAQLAPALSQGQAQG
jgi:anti-sigma factor RsiW